MSIFFRQLGETLARQSVALATVVAAHGSTPRIVGARQFLGADGLVVGSIGGGSTEARTLDLARATLADGQPRSLPADLRGYPGDLRDGVCGGTMTIWIVRLDPERHGSLARAISTSLRAGRRVSLSTTLDAASPLALGANLGSAIEAPPGAFRDVAEPSPRLLVVGAGHIGRALARLACQLDFAVLVQDDRPEGLSPAAFPPACDLEPNLATAAAALRHWEGRRFATLVTRGLPQDTAALDALAGMPGLVYLGLLGSRKRVATVLATRREAEATAIPTEILRAPVGLEIGAETPEEIAVSIAAELIQNHRRSRDDAARSAP